MTELEPK